MTQETPYNPIFGLRIYDRKGNRIFTLEELNAAYGADRRVARTHYIINEHDSGILVSTVHLVIDHNFNYSENKPIIFETMVLCDKEILPKGLHKFDDLCVRASTEQEAITVHQTTCAKIETVLHQYDLPYTAIPG